MSSLSSQAQATADAGSRPAVLASEHSEPGGRRVVPAVLHLYEPLLERLRAASPVLDRRSARRHANAPPDRARLLDAQAEATRAERARRRREIEDEYRPRHDIRPFRLHLVHLPAFVLPVDGT